MEKAMGIQIFLIAAKIVQNLETIRNQYNLEKEWVGKKLGTRLVREIDSWNRMAILME
jgi:hypothetical protein